jgi:hypothetical protein
MMSIQQRLRKSGRRRSLEANLFPGALAAIDSWDAFRWHSESSGADAYKEHSSQALTIDVFGALKVAEHRDAILGSLAARLGLPAGGPWKVDLEWRDPDNLLRERQPSWIDAVAESPQVLIFFECKFTESDGGSCSQVRPIASGRHKGLVQCNGAYTPQTNPANGRQAACALTGKGIQYWSLIPEVFNFPNDLGYLPCPFAGPRFQWMRNLVVCWTVARNRSLQPAFVLAYADGPTLPMAARVQSGDWQRFLDLLRPGAVQVHTLSMQAIVDLAMSADPGSDTWPDLRRWVERKISSVDQARRILPADRL